jgi:hypothetical protein
MWWLFVVGYWLFLTFQSKAAKEGDFTESLPYKGSRFFKTISNCRDFQKNTGTAADNTRGFLHLPHQKWYCT